MKHDAKVIRKTLQEMLDLLENDSDTRSPDMIREMLLTVSSLAREDFDFVELKLLNTAFKELRHALKVFKPYRNVRKAAVFGSARTQSKDPNYRLAVQFGKELSKRGWMIITGGASGIMEAAMVGAGARNSFGLNILLPFEQDSNPIIRGSRKLMFFKYFFTRKLIFLKESEATVLFPGGFGTFDEGYESLTLIQTGKAKPRPLVLLDAPGSSYWESMLEGMQTNMEKTGYVSPGDLDLMRHFQDPRAGANEISQFYDNYHSSRFFKDKYLIRLKRPLARTGFQMINEAFGDLLQEGQFERFREIDQDNEKDPKLERIVFSFDRTNYSRLRQLIDFLNKIGKGR